MNPRRLEPLSAGDLFNRDRAILGGRAIAGLDNGYGFVQIISGFGFKFRSREKAIDEMLLCGAAAIALVSGQASSRKDLLAI